MRFPLLSLGRKCCCCGDSDIEEEILVMSNVQPNPFSFYGNIDVVLQKVRFILQLSIRLC